MLCLALLALAAVVAAQGDVDNDRIAAKIRDSLPSLTFPPAPPPLELKTRAADNSSAQRGMDFLYHGAQWLILRLQPNPFPKNLLTDEVLENPQTILQSFRDNYVEWLQYEQGFVILGGVSLILSLVFTFGFFIYLCCRCCCCRRDKKGKPFVDRRWDACKRRFLTSLMGVTVLVMVFAVAVGFLSNQYVHSSAKRLPDFAKGALDDVRAYRDLNNIRIRKLLTEDFEALNRTLISGVAGASSALVAGIKETTGAAALDSLAKLSSSAVDVGGRLGKIEASLVSVEAAGRELQRQLARLFASLQAELDDCLARSSEESDVCRTARGIFEGAAALPLDELADTGVFAEMRAKLAEVEAFDVAGQLVDARTEFTRLEDGFRGEIATREAQLRRQLAIYARNLSDFANVATQQLSRLHLSDAYITLEQNQGRFSEIEFYRWIAGLVMLSLVGVSVLGFGLGLFYGCCGKRPSYYEDDCCVRATGAKLFCCGTTLGVLFLCTFMVVAVALMFIGGTSENLICDPLRRPDERQDVIKRLEQFGERLKARGGDVDPWVRELTLSHVVEGCKANKTLYDILDLESKLQLTEIMNGNAKEYSDLVVGLRGLTAEFNVPDSLPSLLTPEADARLDQLRFLSIAGLPPQIVQHIDKQLDAFALVQKVSGMEGRVASLPPGPGKEMVLRLIRDLKGVSESSARPLQQRLHQLRANITLLEGRIPNLAEDVPLWLNDLRNAELRLRSNVGDLVAEVGETVAQRLADYIHTYRIHLRSNLRRKIGSCVPLQQISSASISVVCDQTLNPLNSLWASLGLCLLLLIPTMMMATSLRDLYRNTDPFTGSNYSVESDSVPLNSLGTWNGRSETRVNAYSTETDHYAAPSTRSRKAANSSSHYGGASNGRSGGRRSYFDEIGSPPPPYVPTGRR